MPAIGKLSGVHKEGGGMVTAGGCGRFGVIARAAVGFALCAVLAVSAEIGISAGASVLYAGDWGGGLFGTKLSSEPYQTWGRNDSSGAIGSVRVKTSIPWHGGGGSVFADFTYAEVSVGGMYGSGHGRLEADSAQFSEVPDDEGRWTRRPWATLITNRTTYSFYAMNISVLGKYPRKLSDDLKVSLTAGINYAYAVSNRMDEGRTSETSYFSNDEISALWFKFGGIIEYDITDIVYIRPEFLYGIRLPNKIEKEESKNFNSDVSDFSLTPLLGHGFTVKLGLGFRLL